MDEVWTEKRFGTIEVNLPTEEKRVIINCCANQVIEIDKLFGPLAAVGVRVFLEYTDEKADWVVQREKLMGAKENEWIEMARWSCQMDWPEDT